MLQFGQISTYCQSVLIESVLKTSCKLNVSMLKPTDKKEEEKKALNAASICVIWIQSYCVLSRNTIKQFHEAISHQTILCVMMVQSLQGAKRSWSKDSHGTKWMNNKWMVNNYKWVQCSAKFLASILEESNKKWLTATDMLLIDFRGNVFWHVFCLCLPSQLKPQSHVCSLIFLETDSLTRRR